MNTNNKVEITKSGLESLKKELDEMVNVKRPNLVERLSNARTQGDLAENSDYHNAKDELEFLDGRISELEEVVKNAVVVTNNGNGDGVSKFSDSLHRLFGNRWHIESVEYAIGNCVYGRQGQVALFQFRSGLL